MEQNLVMFKNRRTRALFLLVATAILWSMGGLLIKWVQWHPLAIAGMRSVIAAFIIGLVFRSPITWSKAQLGGAVSYAGMVTLFVAATKLTTAANAILLQYTAPIYVALLGAWLLKEKANRLDWVVIGLVFGGMTLFFLDNVSFGGMIGNICAIISGISFALFVLFMRMQKDGSPEGSVLLGNILTFFVGLPFMFESSPGLQGWLGLLLLGTLQLGLSYVLYSIAIKHVTALEATLIPVIEPILNPVWVFLMIGETPGPWAIVGGLIVLLAVTGRCAIAASSSAKQEA